ncbi:D-Ala-D-Ala carboxypeptidase [Aneurinibacillus soli]|uniref:D-alanyl-D-alanine carboxypeptidase n=1 Tax=Aneurinibacillus soli TaxID=1500254 RepID=A0A0U5AXZ7_9BACL|nr:M15 family metallopeptidase [Aneurinibacillus soli]PYE62560.1 D-Ala-D-Ala carboxypeptidase [Aneurinibacillus soli]BAU27122.1 D-alanyl-D-alanine carboxypeptidase [Aneurinibacillus soli]
MNKRTTMLALLLAAASFTAGCATETGSKSPDQATTQPTNQKDSNKNNQSQPDPLAEQKVKAALATTVIKTGSGVQEVTNMNDVLVVVNKKRTIQSAFEPSDLVQPNIPFSFAEKSPRKMMRKEAAKALEELFSQAKAENIDLLGQSAYRPYSMQKAVFTRLIKKYGTEEKANAVSAYPGQSEHQTGLAIDVTSKRMGNTLEQTFGDTPEGKWLAANAPKYGFIIRYPKGKESVTGYAYEPWHIRYVGKTVAQEITKKGLTLEEYLSQ